MKKLFTVALLAGLLSVPSVVFAEATWYGSIRAGVQSDENSGVADQGSRWGIKGSSEVAEGLTAVYRYERKIDSSSASDPGGRLSYVGLSGGFGTITVGQVWSASYNSVGAITDNSGAFGNSETDYRVGNAVSYAVSIGNVSLQADALMNKGGGMSTTVWEVGSGNNPARNNDDSPRVRKTAGAESKTVDAYQFGVTLGNIMETGKLAFAHKRDDALKGNKSTSNFIAAEYGVGGMTLHLGAAQRKQVIGTFCTEGVPLSGGALAPAPGTRVANCADGKQTDTTVFAGLRGGVGDTGVNYVFQMRSKKTKGKEADRNTNAAPDSNDPAEVLDGLPLAQNKHTPWILGLSRNLGGGASVHFEHGNADQKGTDDSTALWLKVDF